MFRADKIPNHGTSSNTCFTVTSPRVVDIRASNGPVYMFYSGLERRWAPLHMPLQASAKGGWRHPQLARRVSSNCTSVTTSSLVEISPLSLPPFAIPHIILSESARTSGFLPLRSKERPQVAPESRRIDGYLHSIKLSVWTPNGCPWSHMHHITPRPKVCGGE